jgi:outer membrane immunogenic protein
LLYATGGLAYGQLSATAPLIPLSWGSTRAGWTVGAGAEVALDHNWSFKVEYLYMDLGNIGGALATATTVTNALNTPSTVSIRLRRRQPGPSTRTLPTTWSGSA